MSRGFTLIELAVSFVVAGILASIGMVGFKDFSNVVRLDSDAGELALFIRRAQVVGASGYYEGVFIVNDILSANPIGVYIDYDEIDGSFSDTFLLYKDVGGIEYVFDPFLDEALDKFELSDRVELFMIGAISPSASCYELINHDLFISFVRPRPEPVVKDGDGVLINNRIVLGLRMGDTARYLYLERPGQISVTDVFDLEGC